MVAFNNIFREKQYVLFRKILILSEKPLDAPVYFLFEIPSHEILLSNFLQTLCNLIVRRFAKEGEFLNKYLNWSCANKWG